MREREVASVVEAMLDRFGWKWRHVPAPMRWDSKRKTWVPAGEAAGLCDYICTHHDPPRLLFLEIKGDKGKLSEAQRDFLHGVKVVAEMSIQGGFDFYIEPPVRNIGVVAIWPKDLDRLEQLLRTRVVA